MTFVDLFNVFYKNRKLKIIDLNWVYFFLNVIL